MTAVRLGKKLTRFSRKATWRILLPQGSSLDKNILELKNVNGMIISTDTALNPLLKHDIIPDLSVTIDPRKSALVIIPTNAR